MNRAPMRKWRDAHTEMAEIDKLNRQARPDGPTGQAETERAKAGQQRT